MERLADRLTRYIAAKGIIDKEDYEMYRYGMLTGLEMTLCIAICAIIAIILKSFPEFIVLVIVFFSLRAYVGGIHFKKFSVCLICSCTVITVLLIISGSVILDVAVSLPATMVNLILIEILAPRATKRAIRDQQEKVYFQRQRRRILAGIAIVGILFAACSFWRLLSLLLYATGVILVSMILGIVKG